MVEFNADVQTNAGSDARFGAVQNISVDSWSHLGAYRGAVQLRNDMQSGEQNDALNCALDDDIYNNDSPKANLPSLFKAEDNFTFAHKEMQDALDALRSGDTKEGIQEIRDAIAQINEGFGNTRDGVGGDFDLSELPVSNPLRRVGSGRQAIKGGRTDLQEALKKLDGDCPDIAGAIEAIENGIGKVLGGTANVNKAVGLLERGQSDHRPKQPDCIDDKPEPVPNCPPAERLPELRHEHEYNTGNRHVDKAIGSLSEAISEIRSGDFNHAYAELRGTLKQIQSGTKDYRYAFGGEVPGSSDFNSAELSVFKAIKNLQSREFSDSVKDIEDALKKLRAGRGDVVRAKDHSRSDD